MPSTLIEIRRIEDYVTVTEDMGKIALSFRGEVIILTHAQADDIAENLRQAAVDAASYLARKRELGE